METDTGLKKLDSATFDEAIYDIGESCLVMFTRKTCHVCQGVHPKIEELASDADYKGKFGFYEIDVEEQRNIFQRFSLKGVPQVLFFDDGEFVAKLAGDKDIEEYEEKIESIIG